MKWLTVPLKDIAPAQVPNIKFSSDEMVWHLTLDQIESHTGNIVDKKISPASTAGVSTNLFDNHNVLYSKLRPYLNKVLCPMEPGIATSELVPLRPRKDLLDRRFLTYYLRSNYFLGFANVAVVGAKMPRIIMTKFWKHRIPLPPLSEQRRIVEILDQADALRKKRAEADAKAARILPALFYKMFGDPATNPKGWPIKPFSDLFSQDKSIVDEEIGKGLPYLGLEHIESETGKILIDEKEALQVRVRGLSFRFGPHHVLYGKLRPYLNKVALPCFEGRCSTELVPLFPASNVPREFVAAYLHLPFVVNAVMSTNKGSRMPRTDMNLLSEKKVPIPPNEMQKRFASIFCNFSGTIEKNQKTRSHIDNLFAVLLHCAFTGNLTAKWREAHMKELLQEMEQQAKALNQSRGEA